jgi:hypothetical protein
MKPHVELNPLAQPERLFFLLPMHLSAVFLLAVYLKALFTVFQIGKEGCFLLVIRLKC